MLAFNNFLRIISKSEHSGANLCRIAIGVVFIWIGLLKFIPYEAESITPFVANSPFMSFFYEHPEEYKSYLNHEGELISKNKAWHKLNNTYGYSNGLGIVEIIFAILILANFKFPLLGLVGAIMAFLTPFITYSFLVFTPETWVQNMGDLHYGFPYLSGAGRLVLKDIMMSACGYVAMIDSAKTLLANRR